MSKKRIRVGVLFGGRSCEHEVSLQSAKAVLGAIDRDKYETVPIGVTKGGQWVAMQDPALVAEKAVLPGNGVEVSMLPDPSRKGLLPLTTGHESTPAETAQASQLDVVFPLIHGPLGEDGTVQGLFDLAGIPYVGSGVLGSAVGMDKATTKALLEHQGLPVASYRVVLRGRWQSEPEVVIKQCEEKFPYPWFVKPANMGSSVGVCKVHNRAEAPAALDVAARYDRKLLVESAVEDAREIEVSVLGNDKPIASVPGEIAPSNEFYDYDAKYLDNASRLIIPAELPTDVTEKIRHYALEAFRTLDCAGLARVDFLVRRSDDAIFVNELNTLPGFTPISMYPKLWEASGIPYRELIDRLIQLALERHQDLQQNKTSYFD